MWPLAGGRQHVNREHALPLFVLESAFLETRSHYYYKVVENNVIYSHNDKNNHTNIMMMGELSFLLRKNVFEMR